MTLVCIPLGREEANDFVREHHRHSKPVPGHKAAIGASDGRFLWGIAIIGRPVARGYDDGFTAELTRVCTRPGAPKGTGSFLYARAWRLWQAWGGKRLVTYTLKSESGASLRGAGWKVIGEREPRKGRGWLNRPGREWQSVYAEPKLCWAVPS